MPLYDQPPPHRITLASSATSRDAGGGTNIEYTVQQLGVPCIINTASATTQEIYAQQGIRVSLTISILSSVLTVTPQPGWKATADDTFVSYKVQGIRSGRQMGTIPAFTYLDVGQML